MNVAERISSLIRDRNISQNKLAKLAGISQSGLSSILSGDSRPREDTLQAIANAFGMSLSELTNDSDTKKEPAHGGRSRTEIILDSLNPENRAKAESYLEYLLTTQDKAET